MLALTEPPPADIGTAETEDMPTSRWLASWAWSGLQLLAWCWRDEGQDAMASWWEWKARSLRQANPLVGLRLGLDVAYGLKDLARRYREAGDEQAYERWQALGQRVEERVWARERSGESRRLGLPC